MDIFCFRLHKTISFSFLFFVKITHFESLKNIATGMTGQNHKFHSKNQPFSSKTADSEFWTGNRQIEFFFKDAFLK